MSDGIGDMHRDMDWKDKRIAELMVKNKELHAALHCLADGTEPGWGGTIKENILCHLSAMLDTKEKFWPLAVDADAGHKRAVSFIVFRAFGMLNDFSSENVALKSQIKRALNAIGPSVPATVADEGARWEWQEALDILNEGGE